MTREGYAVDSASTQWRRTPPEVSTAGMWDIKRDGSCGFEAVSPVIRTVAELKACAKVAKLVADHGGVVNSNCGFHVHVGLRDLPLAHYSRLFAFLTRYQQAFFLLVPQDRRTNSFCKPLNENLVSGIKMLSAKADRCAVLSQVSTETVSSWFDREWQDKNVWLNGKTFARIGTLEFRLLGGTLDPAQIEGYILFLMQVFSQVISGKKVTWGAAKARDERMLFYTMLQQAGCYGKSKLDPDLAKLARTWAVGAYQSSSSKKARKRKQQPAPESPAIVVNGAVYAVADSDVDWPPAPRGPSTNTTHSATNTTTSAAQVFWSTPSATSTSGT